jgi:hypothetical protein
VEPSWKAAIEDEKEKMMALREIHCEDESE